MRPVDGGMFFAAAALVLVRALAAQASILSSRTPASDIEALCARKSIRLSTFEELQALETAAAQLDRWSCSLSIRFAIDDLVKLIKATRADLCSAESISKLRHFYAKNLDTSSARGRNRERLPKSLMRFALSYGMQMSNLCRRQMVRVLTSGGRELLENSEFGLLKGLTGDQSPMSKLLEGVIGADEILLPGDLAPYLRGRDAGNEQLESEPEKLYLQSATGPLIRKLQTACNQHLRPVYMPLVRPIVELANMGFNYKDASLKRDIRSPATAQELSQWSRLVFVCESLNNLHIVAAPAPDQQQDLSADGAQAKVVRILTKEEAAEIGAKEGETRRTAEFAVGAEELRGEPVKLVCETIYDETDTRLAKVISAFKTGKSEEDRIRRRVTQKALAVLKIQVRQGHLGLVLSSGYKTILHRVKTGAPMRRADELVRLVDDLVVQSQSNKDLDGAVAASDGLQLNLVLASIGVVCVGIVIVAIIVGFIFAVVMIVGAVTG